MRNLYAYVFKNKTIKIIMDEDKKIWFVGNAVAKVLNYKAQKKVIQKYVPDDHKKEYAELKIKNHEFTKELQKKSTMIDEIGLYRLALRSKQEVAMEFQIWLTDVVLPSLRETGGYKLPLEIKNKINLLIKKYAKIKKENSILIDKVENDPQKGRGGLYIKPAINYDGSKYYKIGKYQSYNSRTKSYKTGHIKDEDFIFVRECINVVLAESIVKYKLRKCQYAPSAEIFTCKLSTIKNIICKAVKFINLDTVKVNSNNEFSESSSNNNSS
jgi:prophage antirepressor-like protein